MRGFCSVLLIIAQRRLLLRRCAVLLRVRSISLNHWPFVLFIVRKECLFGRYAWVEFIRSAEATSWGSMAWCSVRSWWSLLTLAHGSIVVLILVISLIELGYFGCSCGVVGQKVLPNVFAKVSFLHEGSFQLWCFSVLSACYKWCCCSILKLMVNL